MTIDDRQVLESLQIEVAALRMLLAQMMAVYGVHRGSIAEVVEEIGRPIIMSLSATAAAQPEQREPIEDVLAYVRQVLKLVAEARSEPVQ